MAAPSEINLLLATITRRLDQLTKPTFDRATVEELLAEIFRLRSAEHRGQIAKEIAWRDGKIDEQSEGLDDKDEEIAGLQESLESQRRTCVQLVERIADLEFVNASLSRHVSEALLGRPRGDVEAAVRQLERPNRVLPMVLSDDGLAVFEPASRSRLNLVPTKPERD